jgi:hypothetical protein
VAVPFFFLACNLFCFSQSGSLAARRVAGKEEVIRVQKASIAKIVGVSGHGSTEFRSYFPLVILKYCEVDLGFRDFKGLSWNSLKGLQALKWHCLCEGFFFWRVCFKVSP